jgi:serine O-acetyltransferase
MDLKALEKPISKYSIKNEIKYNHGFRFIFYWRKTKENTILKKYYSWRMNKLTLITGIEIPITVQIGAGFRMIHPYNITINSKAKLGENVTILKGATIGNEKRGIRKGVPYIGDNVYIGLNSTIVGNISVGNDVLIAANSYVNINIPDHSIVIGNPCRIIYKKAATVGYIPNMN